MLNSVLVEKPEEMRPLETPGRRFEYNIKMGLKYIRCKDADRTDVAQDRWWAFADKVMNIRNSRNVRNFVTTRKKSSFSRGGLLFVFTIRFFFPVGCGPKLAMTSSFLRFLDHTQRRTTVGMTPLDE